MKATQKYTPKYWVIHNITEDDVYISTASKSMDDAIKKFTEFYGDDAYDNDVNLQPLLIELKMVYV